MEARAGDGVGFHFAGRTYCVLKVLRTALRQPGSLAKRTAASDPQSALVMGSLRRERQLLPEMYRLKRGCEQQEVMAR
ncbi:hypothetical protein ACWGTO_09875 [Mesorhizobium sp. PL10]